ncbi:MAG: hypothetical protein WD181_00955 [Solirubrobacterales bacterium]
MVGEARPGYELWRPNRAKASSQLMRLVVMLLMVVSIALMLIVIFGGWTVLNGGGYWGTISLGIVFVYALLTVMVGRWSRGAITISVALAVLMLIFAAIGFESWFARDKAGFTEAALPSDLLGLVTFLLIPVQIALAVAASIAVKQEWHVEEERPIGSGDSGTTGDFGSDSAGSAAPNAT